MPEQDSKLSVAGSIVGLVAIFISVVTITQALVVYLNAYRDAPAELKRYTSSISNAIDEKSFRLRHGNVPGAFGIDIGNEGASTGRWADMLQEYFDAHLELVDELDQIRRQDHALSGLWSMTRILWLFRRKDLDERVRRVETLRMRKMAVALNALAVDMSSIKETLLRLESRIPEGPIHLPAPKPPLNASGSSSELPRQLGLYSTSLFGESVTHVVRNSLDST